VRGDEEPPALDLVGVEVVVIPAFFCSMDDEDDGSPAMVMEDGAAMSAVVEVVGCPTEEALAMFPCAATAAIFLNGVCCTNSMRLLFLVNTVVILLFHSRM